MLYRSTDGLTCILDSKLGRQAWDRGIPGLAFPSVVSRTCVCGSTMLLPPLLKAVFQACFGLVVSALLYKDVFKSKV